jgi:uncharacterized protein YjbJ (UPF0337 family)
MDDVTGLSESWDKAKKKLRQKFALLTEGDVLFLDGKKDVMLGRLQAKLGKTKEEIEAIIAKL